MPIDRDRDALVGQRQDLRRHAPGLVAEDPGRRGRQLGRGQVVQGTLAARVGGENAQPGAAQRSDRLVRPHAGDHREVEQAARRRPDRLPVIGVDRGISEDHGLPPRRVCGPQHGAGVPRVAHAGQHRDQRRMPGDGLVQRDVDEPADGQQALRRDGLSQLGHDLAAHRVHRDPGLGHGGHEVNAAGPRLRRDEQLGDRRPGAERLRYGLRAFRQEGPRALPERPLG